tara:strand:+ start:255 stop:749 length:495 start_codon:yes stop_codon:yes gene_type:complete
MKIIGIVGLKNSGKTTIIKNLIKYFHSKKLVIGTIKHAHHNFEIDKEGTDSFIHRKSGAEEVIVSSAKRWAKIEERVNKKERSLKYLIKKIERSDILLIEGFKNESHKKIEIYRKMDNKYKPIYKKIKNVVAIVTNEKIKTKLPIFKLEEIEKIAKFIINNCKR